MPMSAWRGLRDTAVVRVRRPWARDAPMLQAEPVESFKPCGARPNDSAENFAALVGDGSGDNTDSRYRVKQLGSPAGPSGSQAATARRRSLLCPLRRPARGCRRWQG